MPWPSGLDYTETIQSPQTAFESADLRSSIPECRPPQSGIPYGRSGNFATVFKLLSPTGNWAVKCFTREPQDSKARYAAISEFLSKLHSPYMVDFTYLQQGIRIRGQWYPIVKMQWAEGDALDVYIRKNLNKPEALASLAIKWAEMVQALERASLAHGDLQHGNVLVVNSALKLVDYDGMFVPTLAGRRSNELGQPNYQHPGRTDADFGPYLDKFSAWVIYVSLVALSVYPNLWQTFRGGDDCLLFRKRDFENPDQSGLLKTLERCQNRQLRDLVEFFKIALYSSPSDVPSFDSTIRLSTVIEVAAPAATNPSWLQDHVTMKPAQPRQKETPVASADHSWVLDFVAPAGPAPGFSGKLVLQRILLYCSIVVALSAFLFASSTPTLFATGLMIMNGLVTLRRYRNEPAVASRIQSRMRVQEAARELASIRKTIDELDTKKHAVRSAESEQVNKLMKEVQNVLADNTKQREDADRVMRQTTASVLQGKQRIDQQETVELQQMQNTLGTNISSLTQRLNQSLRAETVECAATLRKKQEEYIQNRLEQVRIDGAIPGIGQFVINNLGHKGIRTAADCIRLTRVKVPSVGPRRVVAILDWRQQLEAQARLTMPITLSAYEENAIKSKYAAARVQLESELSNAEKTFKAQEAAIREKYSHARAPFDLQIVTERKKHSSEQQRIAAESKRRQAPLDEAVLRAKQKANEAIAEVERNEACHRGLLKSVQWRLAKARVQSRRFETITFGRYIRGIAIGN
jgi:hypothetical protein